MRRLAYIDEFPRVSVEQVKLLIGGRAKLRRATSVVVHLPDGREVCIDLHRRRATIAGKIIELECPRCRRGAKVLRVVSEPEGLWCARCLNRHYGARYLSQEKQPGADAKHRRHCQEN